MVRRIAIAFLVVLVVSPLMYLGSAFRQANIGGYSVFSRENLIAAFPVFGIAFFVVFAGLCIPWGEMSDSNEEEKKQEDDP